MEGGREGVLNFASFICHVLLRQCKVYVSLSLLFLFFSPPLSSLGWNPRGTCLFIPSKHPPTRTQTKLIMHTVHYQICKQRRKHWHQQLILKNTVVFTNKLCTVIARRIICFGWQLPALLCLWSCTCKALQCLMPGEVVSFLACSPVVVVVFCQVIVCISLVSAGEPIPLLL